MRKLHRVTVMPGDGIGPEVTEQTLKVLEATGVPFKWERCLIGEHAFHTYGERLPHPTLASIAETKVGLKGPTETPPEGHDSINVELRKRFVLGIGKRPIVTTPVRTRFSDVLINIVVYRENLEGGYGGEEIPIPDGWALVSPFTFPNIERFAHGVFRDMVRTGRKKGFIGNKANIKKKTEGLVFTDTILRVAKEYPGIEVSNRPFIDAGGMKITMNPERYDSIILTNDDGDKFSDWIAAFIGGLGFAPGANIGEEYAIFEAVHGTAPDIVGQGIANPSALILSGAMMLDHLGEHDAAEKVRRAVFAVIERGMHVTKDVNPAHYVSAERFTQAVREMMWTS